jgi:hypothetical protein
MLQKNRLHLAFSVFIFILLAISCANPVAPTGGPKDETPPVFLGSNPVNRSRNLKAEKIEMAFDEFVVLKDLNKNLLVSPPLQEKLDVKTKGKGLQIKLNKEEVLAENTTYTIYFGDAVVDLHEGNPLSNLQYVFSTGKDIDSLSIRGKVLDAQYLLPQEGVYVCLYVDNSDSLSLAEMPQHIRPYYVAKTDADGHFEINNIRNDQYLMFAVKDVNANYFNDMLNEEIAFENKLVLPEEVFDFIPDSIPVDTSNVELMDSLWKNYAVPVTKINHTLLLYLPQDSVEKLLSKELINQNRMHFVFKYPLRKDVEFEVLNKKEENAQKVFIPEYSTNRDTLDLWFLKPFQDTLVLRMKIDTLQADTFDVVLNKPKEETLTNLRGNKPKPKTKSAKTEGIVFSSNFGTEFPYFAKAELVFNTPILKANFENVSLLEDSLAVPFRIYFLDSIQRKIRVEYAWKQGKKYRFEIPDQALSDIYGIKNDSIVAEFKTSEENAYGELSLQLLLPENASKNWLVQLIKGTEDNEKLIESQKYTQGESVVFKNLKPDKYRLKILEDRDANGRWTSGDYLKNRLPEKVFYYADPIEIKASWKVDESWTVSYDKQENPSLKKKKKKK